MQLVNCVTQRAMKYLNKENLVKVGEYLRRYISPAYITMLVAALLLWYITKLGETYTTEHEVTIVVDGTEYPVGCTIKGKGTDLIGYTMSSSRSRFVVDFADLSYDKEIVNEDGTISYHITKESMRLVLAELMQDIEITSVGSLPPLKSKDRAVLPKSSPTHKKSKAAKHRISDGEISLPKPRCDSPDQHGGIQSLLKPLIEGAQKTNDQAVVEANISVAQE